jgi:hypothetical protein
VLVILLIVPTYAKVSMIYLLIIPFGTCPAGTYSAADWQCLCWSSKKISIGEEQHSNDKNKKKQKKNNA